MFRSRKKQNVIESYRPAAQSLDRHVYENILSIAFAPDATPEGNALATRDPDGFVAAYLAECDRTSVSPQEISDYFDEVRAFAEEHADEIAEQATGMRVKRAITFNVSATVHSIEVSAVVDTPKTAREVAGQLPRDTGLSCSSISDYSKYRDLNGKRIFLGHLRFYERYDRTGIRRYRNLRRSLNELGYETVFTMPYANSVDEDLLEFLIWEKSGRRGEPPLPRHQREPTELTAEEVGDIEATAPVGHHAPAGYMWVNPDELATAVQEGGFDVADPGMAARALQHCLKNNVMPEEMALMYELGIVQGEPPPLLRTATGLPVLPWEVIQARLETCYGIEFGHPWTGDAEQQFASDMVGASVGTPSDPSVMRIYAQLTDPELIRTYEAEGDPQLVRSYQRLMELMPN